MTVNQKHLRNGLLSALLAIILLALLYVGLIVKSDFERQQDEIGRHLDDDANTILARIDKLFSGYEAMLVAVSESPCIQAADAAACRAYFPRLLERFPQAVNFAATDSDGNIIASARGFDAQQPPSAKDLPFFKALAAGQKRYIMDPHIGPVSGEPIVGLAIPLRRNDGQFAGVVGVTLRFEQLRQLWEEGGGQTKQNLVIFDRHDRPLFASGLFRSNLEQAATLLAPVLHREGPGTVMIGGERLLVHTNILPDGDWKIVALTASGYGAREYLSGNPLVFALLLPLLLFGLLGAVGYARERRAVRFLAASEDRLRSAYAQLETKVDERTAELAESEQHWRLLLDSTAEAIYGIDTQGRCTFCNPAALRMLGESDAGKLLGADMHARAHSAKADGSPYPVAECPIYGVLKNGEQVFVDDEVFFRADGSSFPVRYGVHPIRRDAAIVGAVVTFSDVSESRRKEGEYRSVIQASIDGFWVNDFSGCLLDANDALCRMLGYSREELLGMSINDLEAVNTPGESAAHVRRLIMSGSDQFQSLYRRKDGSVIDVEISALYVAALGQRFFVFVRDISERVRLEEQLRNHQTHLEVLVRQRTADLEQALAAAKLADVTKDAFLANVSHELRTPLNAVIGMAELARRLSHDPTQQAYLDKVGDAGRTLAHLINDLLDLSKIVAGRMEFENAAFSLRRLVQRSNSVMAYKAAEKDLRLSDRIADDVPDILVGDALRIEQILLNLLSNAIKFTAAGRIEIRIGVLAREAERICLEIQVEDSGVGLSEDEIAQLFKPFTQADASMTRKYGGTGLGLAICKHLAEMMGGQISVSSQPGQGSTFRVVLWLYVGKAEDLPAVDGAAASPPPHYRDTHVLVVEDQALNREIVEALLRLVGITPRMVSDGQQALDLLETSGPDAFDLVLMDVQMPIMDGLTATRELRSRAGFEKLPIIAMTAHTMEHEREISAGAGMNDHIGKPFDSASFYRTLAKWLPAAKQKAAGAAAADETIAPPPTPAAGFPSLNGIDCEAGIARFAGNETRYRHWLSAFVEESPATVPQIRQALAAGDSEEARQLAHAFKGRVGMLGMTALHTVVSALEAALKQGEPVEGRLARLAQVVAQTRHDIRCALGLPDHVAAESTPALPPADGLARKAMPDAVSHLLAMLDAGDGGSAAAIACCLEKLEDADWAPRLRQALVLAQDFDFSTARQVLADDLRQPPESA